MGRGSSSSSSSEGDGTWQASNHRLTVLQQAPRGSAVQRESQHVTIARDWRLALHIQQQLKGGMLVAHAASPAMHLIRRRASPSGSSSTVACSSHDVPWSDFPLCVIAIAFLLAKERHSHTTYSPVVCPSRAARRRCVVVFAPEPPRSSQPFSSDPNLLDRPSSHPQPEASSTHSKHLTSSHHESLSHIILHLTCYSPPSSLPHLADHGTAISLQTNPASL